MATDKVFVVGLHKTGTTSLGRALALLGYRVKGHVGLGKFQGTDEIRAEAFRIIDRNNHNAFEDNPWPMLFEEIDQRYPGSKFILTTRPEQSWLKSIKTHFDHRPSLAMEWIYGFGSPLGHEDIYLKVYREHNEKVKELFKHRPDDIIVMQMETGFDWDRLCHFLSLPVPCVDFPKVNTARDREGPLWRRLAKFYFYKLSFALRNK